MTFADRDRFASLPVGRCAALATFIFALFLALHASAQSVPESPAVQQAREIIDSHYDDDSELEPGAVLLKGAYAKNWNDAHVFLQAARLVVMGGELPFLLYPPQRLAAYGQLLDRALELGPALPKARTAGAGVQHAARGRPEEVRRHAGEPAPGDLRSHATLESSLSAHERKRP